MSQITGHISQIIGAVIDVYFDTEGQEAEKVLPKIHDALRIDRGDGRILIAEVQQHIGEDTVRCVAMDNTDGLHRGMEAIPLGTPILMPAGAARHEGCLSHSPCGSYVRGTFYEERDPRDGYQGDRPAGALHEGW